MKIEVNFDDILAEENDLAGGTVSYYIKNAVIANITNSINDKIKEKLNSEINTIVTVAIKDKVNELLSTLLVNLLDYEFIETTSWGERKNSYTVRNRILKAIEEQTVYKKTNYSSDKNPFTRIVDELIDTKLNDFKKAINLKVDAEFTREALLLAEKSLQTRLGIK